MITGIVTSAWLSCTSAGHPRLGARAAGDESGGLMVMAECLVKVDTVRCRASAGSRSRIFATGPLCAGADRAAASQAGQQSLAATVAAAAAAAAAAQ